MYILLSPKGNFLSCFKLMYLFAALDSICAAQSQGEFEQHIAAILHISTLTFIQTVDYGIIFGKCVLCRALHLIWLSPKECWTLWSLNPLRSLSAQCSWFSSCTQYGNKHVVFIRLFCIFSIVMPSDFPEEVLQRASAPFQTLTSDIISRLLIWADRKAHLLRRWYNLHKDWCPSPHLILLLHSTTLSSGPRWYQSNLSCLE